MKIFLNPGHGGSDPGACSASGTKEADITAKICSILAERLKANYYPYKVYQQKYSYLEISKEENKSGATCFISVHCNAAVNQTAKGVEVLYCTGSTKGRQLAEIMQKCLIEGTGLTNRGVKPRNDLHVLNRTKAPAILIETAFISNPTEEKLLKESPEIFAAAIWEAIKIFKSKGLI